MKRLAHLEKSQWWSQEQFHDQQAQHLRNLIHHAYSHVPYYRRIMDERGLSDCDVTTVEDLRRLPPLTKDDIRAHSAQLLNTGLPREQLRAGKSGGTTGERLSFYSTRQERLTYAYARWALTLGWTGVQLGEPHVAFRQRSSGAAPGFLGRLSLHLQRLTTLDTMTVSEENLDAQVRVLQSIRPRTVFSYPSALTLIASYARSHSMECPYVPAVCLGGETMYGRQRDLLASTFGSMPFVRYGSNELHEVAAQCEAKDGLHILAEDFIVEVVDDNGLPLPSGQSGRLLITSLHNYGMPFIRYEPGDIGSLRDGSCTCGRTLPLMEARIWRTREYLVSPTGARVAAIDIDMAQLLPPDVVQWQLVQNGVTSFQLRIVPVSEMAASAWESVRGASAGLLSERLGARVNVEMNTVDHIEMNLSGKRLTFVSKVIDQTWERPAVQSSIPRPEAQEL